MAKIKRRPETDDKPRERRGTRPVQIVAGVCSLLISGAATYSLATQAAPFGVPIPPPPEPMFTVVKDGEYSFRERRLPRGWLGRLALQPDGLPYLFNAYRSEKLQYSVRYPYGAETIGFPADQFLKDAVDSQAIIKIDQPIAAIKVSLPTKASQTTQADYAKELLEGLAEQGAEVKAKPEQAQLPGAGFVTLSYLREGESGTYVHRLYIAGAGPRALVFDFMLPPESADEGARYADKIMRTFEAGPLLGPLLEVKPAKEAAKASSEQHGGI